MISLAEILFLIQQYGLVGLFLSSIAGSTIFLPFPVEVFLPLLVKARISLFNIVLIASLGSVIGTLVNYGVGMLGIKIAYKENVREKLRSSKNFVEEKGYIGFFVLLILPLPLPVDPLTVLAGVWHMDVKKFALVVFLAKLFKYSFTLGLFNFLLKFIGI